MRTRIPLLQKTIGIQIFHGTGAAFTGSKPSFFTCSTTTFPASVTMPLCQTTTAAHGIGKMSATDFFRQRKRWSILVDLWGFAGNMSNEKIPQFPYGLRYVQKAYIVLVCKA